MSKNMIIALVLMVVAVVIFIVNREKTSVDLLFTTINQAKSFVFLGFTALGVVIGVLLK
ncbi:MAG: hypothetical protein KA248_05305 [Kiritimatiellae bacterium]|nr:hypothetical protein [Kiritimatiellia bacterium]